MVLGLTGEEFWIFLSGLMAGSYPIAFITGSIYQKYKQKGDKPGN